MLRLKILYLYPTERNVQTIQYVRVIGCGAVLGCVTQGLNFARPVENQRVKQTDKLSARKTQFVV